MSLPKYLKNFNVFIDGRGMAGVAEEITLPALEVATGEFHAAGMLGPVELDLGLAAMKLDFTLGEYNDDVLKSWGVADVGGINVRFLGAAIAADGHGTAAIEISARGRWKKVDFGTVKAKDHAKMKVEMPLTYYRYSVNGQVLVEIDMIAGKQVVNGVDLTAAVMTAIGTA